MLRRFLIGFLLFLSVDLISLSNERRQIIERVRDYLRRSDATSRVLRITNTLENSNKIGIGYNLLVGSPMCYTSACRMTEFTRAIFKLNYTSTAPGSCINKLIPNNVELDCLPGTLLQTESQMMDTVEHVHTSITNKVQVSVGAKYKGVGFSYSFSRETKNMLDNIVKKHQTSIFTTAEISYFKLSMFAPLMELSDNFRYVIENMPEGEEDDSDIEEYVKDFIFDHFGFTYVSTILLGGRAQETIFIDQEAKERLERNEVNITNEAKLSFDIGTGNGVDISTGVSNSQNNTNYNLFKKEIRSLYTTTVGGTMHLTSLVEWSKTVASSPVIIQFEIRDIFRILTRHYFPGDSFITNKSKLIEQILQQYLTGSVYCYNNCGGNGIRGTCEPTGYFQFGICKCKPGWTGVDCETAIESSEILHGTLCGFDRFFMRVNCHGKRPWEECPKGWAKGVWGTDLTVCYKNKTEVGIPVHGTLCELFSYHSAPYWFEHNIGCNTINNPIEGLCPLGYENFISSDFRKSNAVCAVSNATEHFSGTLCGMQIQHTVDGPSYNNFNPGLSRCPPEYDLKYTAFNDLGFLVCVKK